VCCTLFSFILFANLIERDMANQDEHWTFKKVLESGKSVLGKVRKYLLTFPLFTALIPLFL
jgi:hypothetical protein